MTTTMPSLQQEKHTKV